MLTKTIYTWCQNNTHIFAGMCQKTSSSSTTTTTTALKQQQHIFTSMTNNNSIFKTMSFFTPTSSTTTTTTRWTFLPPSLPHQHHQQQQQHQKDELTFSPTFGKSFRTLTPQFWTLKCWDRLQAKNVSTKNERNQLRKNSDTHTHYFGWKNYVTVTLFQWQMDQCDRHKSIFF